MADSSDRIVKLNTGRVASDDSHLYVRFPAPFNIAKDKGQGVLQGLVQNLFDNVDDALFELADRSDNNAEQNMYFESMREVRLKRRAMEIGFDEAIKAGFRQATGIEEGQQQPPVLQDLAGSNLSLVGNEELEELVAVDSMVAKSRKQFSTSLIPFSKRLDSLIEYQRIGEDNNPLGPKAVCDAFVESCGKLELDIKAKLVLFKLFDRFVMSQLDQVYNACNEYLIQAGILPTASSSEQRRQGTCRQAANSATTNSTQSAAVNDQINEDVFASLQTMLHNTTQQSQWSSNGYGLVPAGQAPQIPRNNLLQLLQQVQHIQVQSMAEQQLAVLNGASPEQLNVQQALNTLLRDKMPSEALSIGQVDDDSINLVAMLFQFILDDRNLATPIKALIARLQIPMIKIAMLDKSFFSKGGHPARKLLNEIANASIGWSPQGSPERDPFYKKVEGIVETLLNQFDSDVSLFQDLLTDFISFLEVEKRRTNLVEQRTLDAEDGKAKSEVARKTVQDALNEKMAGKMIPKTVVNLIEDAWSNVLFLIALKDGTDCEDWNDALTIVDELLWSVEPIANDESRQQLLKRLPDLLKRLRNGLTKIAYNPFDMNQLFDDLEAIHVKQLHVKQAQAIHAVPDQTIAEKPKPAPGPKQANQSQTLDELLDQRNKDVSLEELDSELSDSFDLLAMMDAATEDTQQVSPGDIEKQLVETVSVGGEPAAKEEPVDNLDLQDDDPIFKQVDKLAAGSWIEIHRDDGKKFRCRLAAIIRGTGKYIFVNRSGMKVEEMTRESLAMAIKVEAVTLIDEGLLFDRALESVIGNLRQSKEQPASA